MQNFSLGGENQPLTRFLDMFIEYLHIFFLRGENSIWEGDVPGLPPPCMTP